MKPVLRMISSFPFFKKIYIFIPVLIRSKRGFVEQIKSISYIKDISKPQQLFISDFSFSRNWIVYLTFYHFWALWEAQICQPSWKIPSVCCCCCFSPAEPFLIKQFILGNYFQFSLQYMHWLSAEFLLFPFLFAIFYILKFSFKFLLIYPYFISPTYLYFTLILNCKSEYDLSSAGFP